MQHLSGRETCLRIYQVLLYSISHDPKHYIFEDMQCLCEVHLCSLIHDDFKFNVFQDDVLVYLTHISLPRTSLLLMTFVISVM